MNILLADDDQGTRELVRRALSSDGHGVTAAGDGTAAIELLQTGSFDLLIADIDMPGHDGVSVALEARKKSTGIGVIVISAHDSQLDQCARKIGGHVVTLAKPFTLDAIRQALKSAAG